MIKLLMVVPISIFLAACSPPDQNSTRAESSQRQETEASCAANGGILLDHDGAEKCAFLITIDGVTAGMCEHGDGTVVPRQGAQYCVPVDRNVAGE